MNDQEEIYDLVNECETMESYLENFNDINTVFNTLMQLNQLSIEDYQDNPLFPILKEHIHHQMSIDLLDNQQNTNQQSDTLQRATETARKVMVTIINKLKEMIETVSEKKEEIIFHLHRVRRKDIERLKHYRIVLTSNNSKMVHANLVLALNHREIKRTTEVNDEQLLTKIMQLVEVLKKEHNQHELKDVRNSQFLVISNKIEINQIIKQVELMLNFYDDLVKRLIEPTIHFMRGCFRALDRPCGGDRFAEQNNRELERLHQRFQNGNVMQFVDYYKITQSEIRVNKEIQFQYLNMQTANTQFQKINFNSPNVDDSENLLKLLAKIKDRISQHKSIDRDIRNVIRDGERIIQRNVDQMHDTNSVMVSRLLSLFYQYQLLKIALERKLLSQIGFGIEQLAMLIFKNAESVVDQFIQEHGSLLPKPTKEDS